jgi:hypothetical protein
MGVKSFKIRRCMRFGGFRRSIVVECRFMAFSEERLRQEARQTHVVASSARSRWQHCETDYHQSRSDLEGAPGPKSMPPKLL